MRAEDHIPLKPTDFLVLLTLCRGELHGYGIVGEIERESEGKVRLLPGNLYRVIRRLMRSGLLEESDRRPLPDADDERRRYYRVTLLGRKVVEEETLRLKQLVRYADRLELAKERS